MQTPEMPACLSLVNDHAALDDLAGWLENWVEQNGLSSASAFRLDLVLTEAVTNVIDHTPKAHRDGRIDLACVVRDGNIEVELSDDGPVFDPTARAEAVLPSSLAEATPGGLGIHLMRRYTTRMAFQREQNRNILRMTLPIEANTATA